MPKDNNQQPTTNNNPVSITDDMPPVMIEDTLPPMAMDNQPPPVTSPQPQSSDSGSAAPSNDVIMPLVVTSGPNTGRPAKKFGSGKIIATILGLFLLIGGAGAGTYLVQQNQDIRERAGSCEPGCGAGMMCDGDGGCIPRGTTQKQIDSGEVEPIPHAQSLKENSWNDWQEEKQGITNTGSNCPYNGDPYFSYLCAVGVPQLSEQPRIPSGATRQQTASGAWVVKDASGTQIAEYRVESSGGGEETPPKETVTTTTTTDITAQCQNIKAYTPAWTLLTNTQLGQLKTGDSVNFCVTGSASSGSFDRAKFTINSVVQAETTTVRPTSTDFCQLYVIPTGVTTFNVTAQIHHLTLGWK